MLEVIDWNRPWYASIRTAADKIVVSPDWRAALNAQSAALSLTNHNGLPLSFVEQTSLPEGTAYEAFISETGGIPTRDNLHDFFNALVWLSFPCIKRQLNALQASQIAMAGIGKSRGPARDAATIFDENAALIIVRDAPQGNMLVDALRGHQWHRAFIEQRHAFGKNAEVWLFGHALMEKLMTPYKAITAHTRVVVAPDDFFVLEDHAKRAWIDLHVASELTTIGLSTGSFTPLPTLGVPGWWPEQESAFYDDVSVFRPKKSRPTK